MKKHFSPGKAQTKEQAIARFWSMVDKNGPVPAHKPELGPCWNWKGALWTGYGFFMSMALLGGKTTAHRVAYMLVKGEIGPNLDVDHICRNRACCNPDHLEPVPMGVNVLRGDGITARYARSTHCPYGHERTPENTIRRVSLGRPYRRCKICDQAARKPRGVPQQHPHQPQSTEKPT